MQVSAKRLALVLERLAVGQDCGPDIYSEAVRGNTLGELHVSLELFVQLEEFFDNLLLSVRISELQFCAGCRLCRSKSSECISEFHPTDHPNARNSTSLQISQKGKSLPRHKRHIISLSPGEAHSRQQLAAKTIYESWELGAEFECSSIPTGCSSGNSFPQQTDTMRGFRLWFRGVIEATRIHSNLVNSEVIGFWQKPRTL